MFDPLGRSCLPLSRLRNISRAMASFTTSRCGASPVALLNDPWFDWNIGTFRPLRLYDNVQLRLHPRCAWADRRISAATSWWPLPLEPVHAASVEIIIDSGILPVFDACL